MNINEIRVGMNKLNLTGKLESIGEARTVSLKTGGTNSVATCVLSDETDSIKLNLWGADIDKFKQGDKVKIENAMCTAYKGELQLSTGKFGKISRV